MADYPSSAPSISLHNKSSLPFYKYKRSKPTGNCSTPNPHNQSQIVHNNCNSITTEIDESTTLHLSNQSAVQHGHTLSPHKDYSPTPFPPPANRTQKSRSTLSPTHIPPSQLNVPIRSTLKNLLSKPNSPQHHSPPATLNRTTPVITPQNQTLNNSQKMQITNEHPGIKRMQAENSILKEENELLRKQLSDIKKMLMKDTPKQQEISNLRQTIKREDSQNKELKLKMEIQIKKVQAMEAMLSSKEEEISFLSGKVEQLERELVEEREGQAVRVLQLRERVLGLSEACCAMEEQSASQEKEWAEWREAWQQEKTLYLHRIQFLQQYIAQQHQDH